MGSSGTLGMENCLEGGTYTNLGLGLGLGLGVYEHLKLEICDLFSASDCKVQEQEPAKYLDQLNSLWDDGFEKCAPSRGISKGITLLPKN